MIRPPNVRTGCQSALFPSRFYEFLAILSSRLSVSLENSLPASQIRSDGKLYTFVNSEGSYRAYWTRRSVGR